MLRKSIAVALLIASTGVLAQSMNQAPPTVVPSERLENYWTRAASTIDANVPNHGKNLNVPGCATVSFVVESDGTTSTIKVQNVVPEGDLGSVAASVAAGMRFDATAFNAGKKRVFSWLIFPFNLPSEPAARSAVMQKCQITQLGWKDH